MQCLVFAVVRPSLYVMRRGLRLKAAISMIQCSSWQCWSETVLRKYQMCTCYVLIWTLWLRDLFFFPAAMVPSWMQPEFKADVDATWVLPLPDDAPVIFGQIREKKRRLLKEKEEAEKKWKEKLREARLKAEEQVIRFVHMRKQLQAQALLASTSSSPQDDREHDDDDESWGAWQPIKKDSPPQDDADDESWGAWQPIEKR